jgi:hypothetical protein
VVGVHRHERELDEALHGKNARPDGPLDAAVSAGDHLQAPPRDLPERHDPDALREDELDPDGREIPFVRYAQDVLLVGAGRRLLWEDDGVGAENRGRGEEKEKERRARRPVHGVTGGGT